jgi:hypothetical protein
MTTGIRMSGSSCATEEAVAILQAGPEFIGAT